MDSLENYYGRQFVDEQVPIEVAKLAKSKPATFEKDKQTYCRRCYSLLKKAWQLPSGAYYCRECLTFGRITTENRLLYFPPKNFAGGHYLRWEGQLTSHQLEISEKLLAAVQARENVLVHAVTGAGKTEMIYGALAGVLNAGGSVAVVSPRIDVCRELYQRFKKDFSCPMALLHHGSAAYQDCPLLIATVHQLFKFYRAFDLIVIDEVDAFPYVDDAHLYRAVARALKISGSKIFLTATSTDQLDRQVKRGDLTQLYLARRFHGFPLVLPRPVWLGNLDAFIAKGRLPKRLVHDIEAQRRAGQPLLMFYPTIKEGELLAACLKQFFPDETIGFVSSRTENRLSLVEDFRAGKIGILVSTTILERGVTFPGVDVLVLGASHKLYTKSALVQIGGRVGRSSDRPTGLLIFYHDGLTKAIRGAMADIKAMNKRGGFA